jgi:hypothetical protein
MLLKKLMFYIPERELVKFAAFSGSATCWPIPYRTLEKVGAYWLDNLKVSFFIQCSDEPAALPASQFPSSSP